MSRPSISTRRITAFLVETMNVQTFQPFLLRKNGCSGGKITWIQPSRSCSWESCSGKMNVHTLSHGLILPEDQEGWRYGGEYLLCLLEMGVTPLPVDQEGKEGEGRTASATYSKLVPHTLESLVWAWQEALFCYLAPRHQESKWGSSIVSPLPASHTGIPNVRSKQGALPCCFSPPLRMGGTGTTHTSPDQHCFSPEKAWEAWEKGPLQTEHLYCSLSWDNFLQWKFSTTRN